MELHAAGGVAFCAALATISGYQFLKSLRPELSKFRKDAIKFQFTATGIDARSVAGEHTMIEWAHLTSVEIVTTSEGPFVDDIFWGLYSANEKLLAFSHYTTDTDALLRALNEHLNGFDNRKFIEAMGSSGDARFILWEKQGSEPIV